MVAYALEEYGISLLVWKMDAVLVFKMAITTYKITWRHKLEDDIPIKLCLFSRSSSVQFSVFIGQSF
jgi:hypothetical protein